MLFVFFSLYRASRQVSKDRLVFPSDYMCKFAAWVDGELDDMKEQKSEELLH